jgi:uncharacterized membrane protein
VFAVAITLLALNLAVEGPGHGTTLLHQLGHHWPSFVAYVISFFTIGIIWVNHHTLIASIAVVNRTLLFLNLLLLLIIVAIPFVTATMAAYLTAGGQDAHVAAALYAGTFELIGLTFTGVLEWALHEDQRLHQPVPAAARTTVRTRFYIGQLPYLIAVGVAFISAPASVIITALVPSTTSSSGPLREPDPTPLGPPGFVPTFPQMLRFSRHDPSAVGSGRDRRRRWRADREQQGCLGRSYVSVSAANNL